MRAGLSIGGVGGRLRQLHRCPAGCQFVADVLAGVVNLLDHVAGEGDSNGGSGMMDQARITEQNGDAGEYVAG